MNSCVTCKKRNFFLLRSQLIHQTSNGTTASAQSRRVRCIVLLLPVGRADALLKCSDGDPVFTMIVAHELFDALPIHILEVGSSLTEWNVFSNLSRDQMLDSRKFSWGRKASPKRLPSVCAYLANNTSAKLGLTSTHQQPAKEVTIFLRQVSHRHSRRRIVSSLVAAL